MHEQQGEQCMSSRESSPNHKAVCRLQHLLTLLTYLLNKCHPLDNPPHK